MKIHEVEAMVGIPKKNIRFYEEEGLLSPARNRENGYRVYSEEEVIRLKQIKLLRKLGLSLEEIRQMQLGVLTVADAMNRHQTMLARQEKSLEQARALCVRIEAEGGVLDGLDGGRWLEEMARMEEEGTRFMNKDRSDGRRKLAGAALGAGIMIALMVLVAAVMFWGQSEEPLPLVLFAGVMAIPVLVILGCLAVLWQRKREIEGGEEDEAGQY